MYWVASTINWIQQIVGRNGAEKKKRDRILEQMSLGPNGGTKSPDGSEFLAGCLKNAPPSKCVTSETRSEILKERNWCGQISSWIEETECLMRGEACRYHVPTNTVLEMTSWWVDVIYPPECEDHTAKFMYRNARRSVIHSRGKGGGKG